MNKDNSNIKSIKCMEPEKYPVPPLQTLKNHKVSRGEFLTYGLGTLLALTGIGGIINPKRTTLT